MDQGGLLIEMGEAMTAVTDAENELARLRAGLSPPVPEGPDQLRDAVHDATLALEAAKAKLADLEEQLRQARADAAERRFSEAKRVILEAEGRLDRAIEQMQVQPVFEDAWVSSAVESALADLKAAKQALLFLQSLSDDEP